MCILVYIAAKERLPLVELHHKQSKICVRELEENEQQLAKRFSNPYVYYVGAYENCGCGFSYGLTPIKDAFDREIERDAQGSVQQLSAYLAAAVAQAGDVEMFVWWDGEEDKETQFHLTATPADFGGHVFELPYPALISIVAQ